MFTNADAVEEFIADHKGGQWAVGDRFLLPDIEQAYEVVAVRPFKHRGKFRLFVDLEAACAVDGCPEYFLVTKEVHQWMASPHLTRCCSGHRFGFNTEMAHAWKTQAQIAAMVPKQRKVRRVKGPRIGPNERAVLGAIADMSLVADDARQADVVEHAIGKLPPGDPSKRDTRRQSVVRALNGLVQRECVRVASGRVLL